MGSELVKVDNNLEGLLEGMHRNKANYLAYLAAGITASEAMRMLGLSPKSLRPWRGADKHFHSIELQIKGSNGTYKEEAIKKISSLFLPGVLKLASRINTGFDGLNEKDKAHVKWAIDYIQRFSIGKRREEKDNYEEFTHRIKREMK